MASYSALHYVNHMERAKSLSKILRIVFGDICLNNCTSIGGKGVGGSCSSLIDFWT